MTNKQNKYIVIHYVGATGGAEANCKYFKDTYRSASAHYFVGHKGEIWQSVEDSNKAWHCGAKAYKHSSCRNSNSIGIEMCCRKDTAGKWYFEEATITATISLVKELMAKYKIPVENVIRHYDVTGKTCPEPYVRDTAAWNTFKKALVKAEQKPTPAPAPVVKKTVDQIAQEVIAGKWGNGAERKQKLTKAGYNYSAVQAKVNELCNGKAPAKKTNEQIAKEVIAGKWGNGAERKKRLAAAGYNSAAIQKIVNRLLK